MTREQKLALFAYISICIIWGSTYLAIRVAVLNLPPLFSAGVRFIISGLIMYAYAYIKKRPLPTKQQWKNQTVAGLIILTMGNGMVVLGSQWTDSSIVTVLFATAPLYLAVLEIIFIKVDRLSLTGWLGLLTGFSGVLFLVLSGQGVLNFTVKGVSFILLGAFFWSSGSIVSKILKSEGAIEYNLSIQMLSGGIGFMIAGLLMGEASHITFTLEGALAILYLITFGSLIGYTSYIYLLSVWPASKAGTYAYVNPFVGIFLGHLILKEPITHNVFIGTTIILLGVFMVQFSKRVPLQK